MSNLAESFCCPELNISVRGGSYLTSFQVDGIIRQQKVFETDMQVVDWTNKLLNLNGPDLYVRLRSHGPYQKRAVLELARKLSRPGLLIGLAGQRSVCRSKTRGYNERVETFLKQHERNL
jgi:hypothetical protein